MYGGVKHRATGIISAHQPVYHDTVNIVIKKNKETKNQERYDNHRD